MIRWSSLFFWLVVVLVVVLVLMLSKSVLLLLVVGAAAVGGWYWWKGRGGGASTLGYPAPPLARREAKRRLKVQCQQDQECAAAPPPRWPPVAGQGNSICNDQPDVCSEPCYQGIRQPTVGGGRFCGMEDDPNFAPLTNRTSLLQGMDVDDDHYAADGHRALYMEDINRLYNRDRNGMMMARNMLRGSTRPTSSWADARQGWNMAAFGSQNVKNSRYLEVVDKRLLSDFKENNYA